VVSRGQGEHKRDFAWKCIKLVPALHYVYCLSLKFEVRGLRFEVPTQQSRSGCRPQASAFEVWQFI